MRRPSVVVWLIVALCTLVYLWQIALPPAAERDTVIGLGFVRFINTPAVVVLGLWFLVQFFSIAAAPAEGDDVAFWAHAGGFIAGIVLVPLFKDREVPLFGGPYSAAFALVRPRDMRR